MKYFGHYLGNRKVQTMWSVLFLCALQILSISGQSCTTSDTQPNCEDCVFDVWICGGVTNYERTFCNEVVKQKGNNSIGCSLPTGLCSSLDHRTNGTTLDWDSACGEGVPCTTEEFNKFVQKQNHLRKQCENRGGINASCCPDPCTTMECFCPGTAEEVILIDHAYTCEDVGTSISKTDYTVVRAEVVNTYCFEDCLCCYSEECCKSDSCRPYIYLEAGDPDCCSIQCYEGDYSYDESSENMATRLSSFLFI